MPKKTPWIKETFDPVTGSGNFVRNRIGRDAGVISGHIYTSNDTPRTSDEIENEKFNFSPEELLDAERMVNDRRRIPRLSEIKYSSPFLQKILNTPNPDTGMTPLEDMENAEYSINELYGNSRLSDNDLQRKYEELVVNK